MSPLPCPDLHPALLQSIPALQPVETTISKFINKEWASEASPTPCIYYNYAHVYLVFKYLLALQFAISTLVTPWDNLTMPPGVTHVDNIEAGKALLGVIIHPKAKGVTLNVVVPETLKKLAENGTL